MNNSKLVFIYGKQKQIRETKHNVCEMSLSAVIAFFKPPGSYEKQMEATELKMLNIDPKCPKRQDLVIAAMEGASFAIRHLLRFRYPAAELNKALKISAQTGNISSVVDICELGFRRNERGINPAHDNNRPLILAVVNNHLSVVMYLCTLGCKHPEMGIDFNMILLLASSLNHWTMVWYLCTLPGVDPVLVSSSAQNPWMCRFVAWLELKMGAQQRR